MVRLRIAVTGIVQGVGFRPFIYLLAERCQVTGWVLNNSDGVKIEVQGSTANVAEFVSAMRREAPPLAVIAEIVTVPLAVLAGESGFAIQHSNETAAKTALVSPDVATCLDCQREMADPADRRYRYPFINCTNCGPRYTIIKDVPYDRAATTMSAFTMCPACQAEYDDPANRRFHAQPNACAVCGPHYQLCDRQGQVVPGDVFEQARHLIEQGAILAIKGLGGYHLACAALNEQAVSTLRRRKTREDKPFAVMCGSLAAVRRLCTVSAAEEKLLTGMERPIVLLAKQPAYDLAAAVAPGNPQLGVMLPYAPVHWLLLDSSSVWVMTSGNTSDEPIAYVDDDARERLAGIADYFLEHNRVIYRRADDSVVRVFRDEPYVLRRSRGFVPAPLTLPWPLPAILATGGELKNTFCLTRGTAAFLSAHIGDLENLPTYEAYVENIEHYQKLFAIKPECVAHDCHPEYLATKYALTLGLPAIPVQHHHAHIAAVLAEHAVDGQVIGVAFDGTGYGLDGCLWGGEFFIADCGDFTRAGHCRYLPLPGGAKAIREPWRLAAWALHTLYGQELMNQDIPFIHALPSGWQLAVQAAEQGLNAPLASGAGRLFDLTAALLGLRQTINYEGQAAIELELAAQGQLGAVLPYAITGERPAVLDFLPTVAAMTELLRQGRSPGSLAADFHTTVAAAVVAMVESIAGYTGLRKVALSGGVWQNMTLLSQTMQQLEARGFTVYIQRRVPPNDGGLALGQAIVASRKWRS